MLVWAAAAHAAQWIQVTGTNPNGAPANYQGWVGSGGASTSSSPIVAALWPSSPQPANVGGAFLTYYPPAGSTIGGGSLYGQFTAGGGGSSGSGISSVLSPQPSLDAGDTLFACTEGFATACDPGDDSVAYQVVGLAGAGGTITAAAQCGGVTGGTCTYGGTANGTIASAAVYWADVILNTDAQPSGSAFSGSLLSPNAHGTANLQFNAAEPNGPGVWQVLVRIDGNTVYSGTPNTNSGQCVSQGNSDGIDEFDGSQPCLQSETVDLTLSTAGLADGSHRLQVFVEDPAQTVTTVLDQTITTMNRTTISSTLGENPPSENPPTSTAPTSPGSGGGSAPAPAPVAYAFRFTKSSLHLAAKVLHRGYRHSHFELTGELQTPSGQPAVNIPIAAQAGTITGKGFRTVASTSTDGAGNFTVQVPDGDSRIVKITAGAGVVAVKETVSPTVSLKVKVLPGGRLRFIGRVAIKLNGVRPQVNIKDYAAGSWHQLLSGQTNRKGYYQITATVPAGAAGATYPFRAGLVSGPDWAGGVSSVHKVTVR